MSFNRITAELQGSILTWLPIRDLLWCQSRSKCIDEILTKEASDANFAGQELFKHISENFPNYFLTSSQNWSIPPREHIKTVKDLIELFLSLFSSPYPANVQKCCTRFYFIGEKNEDGGTSWFSRSGEVIASNVRA